MRGSLEGIKIAKYNWDYLKELTEDIPSGLDKSVKKQSITKDIREQINKRDKVCQICGKNSKSGLDGNSILQVHHIIPNGKAELENLTLLCKYCHQNVHNILYAMNKWKFVNVLKGIYW